MWIIIQLHLQNNYDWKVLSKSSLQLNIKGNLHASKAIVLVVHDGIMRALLFLSLSINKLSSVI